MTTKRHKKDTAVRYTSDLPPCRRPCPTPFRTIFFVGRPVVHHVGYLVHLHVGHHVHLHVGHHNVVSTLCEGSETLTEWKSEIITYGRRRQTWLTRVGAGDALLAHLKNAKVNMLSEIIIVKKFIRLFKLLLKKMNLQNKRCISLATSSTIVSIPARVSLLMWRHPWWPTDTNRIHI